MPAQAKRTAEFLQHEQGEAAKAVRAQNPNAKLTEEQLATLTDARIIGTAKEGKKEGIPGTAKEMHSNVEQPLGGDRVENIYRAPDVNTMGQAYPNLTQTKVWNEVIVPVAAAGKPSPSANQILKQAALKIAEGKITPEQAAGGLKAYFAGAIALNNRTALYKEVGLPVQEGYKVLVDRPEQPFKLQPFGTIDVAADWIYRDKSVGLDMNNESQIINYLMRFGRGK
jgi:hypothetical protein